MMMQYIKEHRRILCAFVLMDVIFFVSFYLYRLPLRAVLYPTLVCFFACLVFFICGYLRFKTKHRQLKQIRAASATLIGELPRAETVTDSDYRRIIELLCEEQAGLLQSMNERYSNMVEYYTVWAHQIKTPIAAMRISLQNEDSPLSRRLSADLNRIEQYVDMVLTFLRLDSDSTDYVFREYELDGILRQSVKKFSGEFIGRHLSLSFEPTNMRIVTDEKWLGFVLEQLIFNALKYTQSGGITIKAEGERELLICDTGMGIAPEDLPRIFEKGYTGFNGRADKKASGIGLYLCKRICSNLGINISAESELGKGTTVRLQF